MCVITSLKGWDENVCLSPRVQDSRVNTERPYLKVRKVSGRSKEREAEEAKKKRGEIR